jgi:hypothetical protein
MASQTYELITTNTLASAVSSVTLGSGSSIPQTYTDLVLVMHVSQNTGGSVAFIEINGDTDSNNYSLTEMGGVGTNTPTANARTSNTGWFWWVDGILTGFSNSFVGHFLSYRNSSHRRTMLGTATHSNMNEIMMGLWNASNAITQLRIYVSSGSFQAGSVFSLYGIRAA